MARKRMTQVFPFLLPVRQWQRKLLFYIKMQFDKNKYAKNTAEKLPALLYESKSLMLNENSGYDIQYQINKVHNLKLAAKTVDNVVIRPGETFSFWQLVRFADKHEAYKDGLVLTEGTIRGAYGGGLCQLSNMLFWLFLHTPLTIVERHGHSVLSIPPASNDEPKGVDAAVSEGWLDIKVRNDTKRDFQIIITFDEKYMYGKILTNREPRQFYEIFNRNVSYFHREEKVYQTSSIWQKVMEKGEEPVSRFLYNNTCEIGFKLPEDIEIQELINMGIETNSETSKETKMETQSIQVKTQTETKMETHVETQIERGQFVNVKKESNASVRRMFA